jgi:hypothetical protein
MEYVSPIDERAAAEVALAPRPDSLDGRTIALLDISKPRGDEFLDRVEAQLQQRGATVLRRAKPIFSRPAPSPVVDEIAGRADAVVVALAD